MSEHLRDLVEDSATTCANGEPALVLVDDYLERSMLVESLTQEADLYGVHVLALSRPEQAQAQLPTAAGAETRAAVVLVDAGEAATWASWLEANREALPQWVRFLIVLIMPADVPILSRAPAFMSWAKGLEFRKLEIPGAISDEDVEAELARLERETGMSAEVFVEAWKRGRSPRHLPQHHVVEPRVGRITERAAMSQGDTSAEAWLAWRATSRTDAEKRWEAVQKVVRPERSGKEWLAATRGRLVNLAKIGILQPHEQGRLQVVEPGKLARADQKRLEKQGLARDLYAFAVSAESAAVTEPLASRSLRLSPGRRLRDGRLSFQVFVKESSRLPIGMNIQLRGTDPTRENRPTYLRYDLDVVAMGEKAGSVTHFNAHWHAGDDPDGSDAEDHDPRLPSLLLDPLAVLDILVETFFPNGPADVEDPPAS